MKLRRVSIRPAIAITLRTRRREERFFFLFAGKIPVPDVVIYSVNLNRVHTPASVAFSSEDNDRHLSNGP